MNLSEQVNKAILVVKSLFKDTTPTPPIPEGMTIETLWVMYQETIRGKRKKHTPGVEETVKLLLEDTELPEIPISMIAEIIRSGLNENSRHQTSRRNFTSFDILSAAFAQA